MLPGTMPLWDTKPEMRLSESATGEIKSAPHHDAPSEVRYTTKGQDLGHLVTGRPDSTVSQRYHGARPLSKASIDSFYTAAEGSNDSDPARAVDMTQSTPASEQVDTAKTFATRAWQEDRNFVEVEELVEWFAFPSDIRQQALGYYMEHFEFSNMDIDESIRLLCAKLYIKGGGQQIDKILEVFSERYISQNPGSVWKHTKIVHTISLAIILLDTHLRTAEFGPRIPGPRFTENVIRAIRIQMEQESIVSNIPISGGASPTSKPRDGGKFSRTPPVPYEALSSNASSLQTLGQRFAETRNWFGRTASGAVPSHNDSWIVVTAASDAEERSLETVELSEPWVAEISLALVAVYNRVQTRPIIIRTRDNEALTSLLTYESRSSFISSVGYAPSLPTTSIPQFLKIASNSSPYSPSEANSAYASSPWAKSGQLLWKSMKPTAGRIAKPKRWRSVTATVQGTLFCMNKPVPPGSTKTGRQLGTLSLLHTLAIEVPAPKGAKIRSFGLTLASGETHMFEIPEVSISMLSRSRRGPDPDAEVLAWVRSCNYYAARYSRTPPADAMTDVEYGWNGAFIAEDDQSAISDRPRNVPIDEWVAPTLPYVEAQTDLETQLGVLNKQVEACNTEFAEHGELRGRMMNLYRPGSAHAQKALSNWEKKAQYLLTEIVKYETYAEILKHAEYTLRSCDI